MREILEAANRRYLELLSAIEDPRNGRDQLGKLSQPVQNEGRSYPGFNLFDTNDEALFSAIARGEFNISGMQNKTLRRFLREKNSGQVSRLLKRLSQNPNAKVLNSKLRMLLKLGRCVTVTHRPERGGKKWEEPYQSRAAGFCGR